MNWQGQPGRASDVELVCHDALAASGGPAMLAIVAASLETQPEHEEEVEPIYRQAISAGNPFARRELAKWLEKQPGRTDEVEQVYHEAIAAGDPDAITEHSRWLSGCWAAERADRKTAAASDASPLCTLAWSLATQHGREDDAIQAYREAAMAGESGALRQLARWLEHKPWRAAEVEQVYRECATDDVNVLCHLARWLGNQPGRSNEVEQVYREAYAAGVPAAPRQFVDWLTICGRHAEATRIRERGLDL